MTERQDTTGSLTAVTPQALKAMLLDGGELALLDVREEEPFSISHLLFACSLPLSRLELQMPSRVPRKSTRTVLCDAGDGLAERAGERLTAFGYADVTMLAGGIEAWREAGFELFSGVNVPSKAFGEFVEHRSATPSIDATELDTLLRGDADVMVLDSRPWDEYHRMNIPSGIDAPGAELVYRVHDLVPSPDTLIVVNCAGRTRSIIGAQSLINAGIPNRVVALRNGTMGWELAGLACERGAERLAPDPSPQGLAAAKACSARVAERFAVRSIDKATAASWRNDASRSCYLLDVRSPEEYRAGHLPGSISAPGGQLVQATDQYVGTLGARLVLIDDTGVRATMTASWLIQMGWRDAVVLADGLSGAALESGAGEADALGMQSLQVETITATALHELLEGAGATLIDLSSSRNYREAHIPGAMFAVRSRLGRTLVGLPITGPVILTSEDGRLASLAASEVAAVLGVDVRVLHDGNRSWAEAGFETARGEENMGDLADDVWLKPYERAHGIEAAMQEYLRWEIELVGQIERDATTSFRHFN